MARVSILAVMAAAAWLGVGKAARAQLDLPDSAPPDGAALFTQQCATCHTLNASEAQRQGPTLAGVFGRPAGSIKGFKYSPGFVQAKFSWDAEHLDSWLTRPEGVIPTAIMPYAQADPNVRHLIISYLKDQH